FIEVVRGAPLIMWLFITSLLLPLLLDVDANSLPAVMRAYVAITLFSAAYMAENVRGGLQAVPRGQGEAARALGLSAWQTTYLIVLPQALRAVIPAIVGQAIGLFKDTSLVFIVGLVDFFKVADIVSVQPESLLVTGGVKLEVFLFIAAIYFFFAYRMSIATDEATARQPVRADAPAGGTKVIEMIGVNKWYGEFHVLKDIHLSVNKGEVVVVIGPSGSGKSTLIRCINRLEEHQEGKIVVDGVELTDDVRAIDQIRRETGMVFQSFNLFPHLTVLDNITLAPIRVRKWKKSKAEERARYFLEKVGIPEQASKYPGQLSGGQQQRVAIARSLTMEPKVMLFDEPTSA